jgi:LysM repeat protein
MLVDGKLYWTSILYYADSSQLGGGGGGGGSGLGFYQLNLSGSPIVFPTATPVGITYSEAEIASFLRYTVQTNDTLTSIAASYNVSTDDLMRVNNLTDSTIFTGEILVLPGVPGPTRVDGEHGTVLVTNFQKPDGRKRTQYTFLTDKDLAYYELKGDNLEALQKAAYRPIAIWGKLSFDQFGAGYITVEKFEDLYPGLQEELLTGTQTTQTTSNGESLVLFTTGGVTYVQMALSGGYPDGNFIGDNVEVAVRGILVPGETYAGYPALRVAVIGSAVNPATGERQTLDALPNESIPDPFGNADAYIPPDIIIDKVELIYFASNPANSADTPDLSPAESYIQPVWSFEGHDTNGNVLNFLIQALQQEFLSPEITPTKPLG